MGASKPALAPMPVQLSSLRDCTLAGSWAGSPGDSRCTKPSTSVCRAELRGRGGEATHVHKCACLRVCTCVKACVHGVRGQGSALEHERMVRQSLVWSHTVRRIQLHTRMHARKQTRSSSGCTRTSRLWPSACATELHSACSDFGPSEVRCSCSSRTWPRSGARALTSAPTSAALGPARARRASRYPLGAAPGWALVGVHGRVDAHASRGEEEQGGHGSVP